MAKPQLVFIGINGNVNCLDRSTGQILWQRQLRGDFVNILVDGDLLLATAGGEAYCMEADTGKLLWHNELKGQGRGLATVATYGSASNVLPLAEKKRQEEAAAAATSASAG